MFSAVDRSVFRSAGAKNKLEKLQVNNLPKAALNICAVVVRVFYWYAL